MTIGMEEGDEICGERIACIFRKETGRVIVPQTGGHRAVRMIIKGKRPPVP